MRKASKPDSKLLARIIGIFFFIIGTSGLLFNFIGAKNNYIASFFPNDTVVFWEANFPEKIDAKSKITEKIWGNFLPLDDKKIDKNSLNNFGNHFAWGFTSKNKQIIVSDFNKKESLDIFLGKILLPKEHWNKLVVDDFTIFHSSFSSDFGYLIDDNYLSINWTQPH